MATECRKRKINRHKLVKVEAHVVLIGLVVVGLVIGFFIGKSQAKVKTETVTVTETVEVPVYEADRLPEVSDVFYFDVPLSHSEQRFIYEVCADEEVPVTLIMAMIEHESQFTPDFISHTNDYGLLQINAVNHEMLEERYRTADMLNPYQNIYCGVKIISSYLAKYDGNYTQALMAYNMGDYGARKAWSNGIESTRYTETILSIMQEYEEVVRNATSNNSH
jgi:hypothetical protein